MAGPESIGRYPGNEARLGQKNGRTRIWARTGTRPRLPADHLTIILLPSRSPELNPVENIWQYLRQYWL